MKFLEYHRDYEYKKILQDRKYQKFRKSHSYIDKDSKKEIVESLRDMANEIESNPDRIVLFSDLPERPLFNNKQEWIIGLEVSLLFGPIGG